MNFTEQQQAAIADQDIKFDILMGMISEGHKKLGIFGPAGVGKTHMAERLIRAISEVYIKTRGRVPMILCGAISHQACGVLERMVESIEGIEFDVKTLASALHLKKHVDSNGVETFVYKEKKQYIGRRYRVIPPPIAQCDIFISDECSQLDAKQLAQIDSLISPSAYQFYLGDICQLPPIDRLPGELCSPIFSIPHITLSIPFRYEGDLMTLGEATREQILLGLDGKPFDMDYWRAFTSHKGKDYEFTNSKAEFMSKMVEYNRDNENPYRVKFICYKNFIHESVSTYIRNQINPNVYNWEPGDLIRATQTYNPDGTRNVLVNSEHGIIERKSTAVAKVAFVDQFGSKDYFGIYTSDRPDEQIIDEVEEITGMKASLRELKYFIIKLNGKNAWIPIFPMYPKEFEEISQSILANRYYPREDFDNNKWNAFYDLKNFFAEITYGYGSNSHTAQGLTLDTVGIHAADIFGTTKATPLERLQSFYVAQTRAKYKAFIYYE